MSTPDQPDQNPQNPDPGAASSGPPAYGAPQPGAPQQPQDPQHGAPRAPQYGAQEPQYGAPQAPQYGGPPQAPQYGTQQPGGTPGYGAPAQDPGKTLGIVGLVLSFLGCLSIVGLVLSIVALNKSKKAGYKNGVAVAGIIVGALVLIGTVIFGVLAWQGIQLFNEVCEGVPSGETVYRDGVEFTCP